MTTASPSLTAALAELLDVPVTDIPQTVGVSWVCDVFGITQTAVLAAIRRGKLPRCPPARWTEIGVADRPR